ncbi:uncharacterized protein LOC109364686 [Meleagris gallopavo]|uniref:uncharacterized protein LOC109364686 n=1 Tax=Meleagris gallopavo TaxID=9103 RepID=UPI00093FCEE3|nr:uncharacterized protein LOC109364686 [Meleagris gallopavo]
MKTKGINCSPLPPSNGMSSEFKLQQKNKTKCFLDLSTSGNGHSGNIPLYHSRKRTIPFLARCFIPFPSFYSSRFPRKSEVPPPNQKQTTAPAPPFPLQRRRQGGQEQKRHYDPDVIRTRSLLIWSQTRYRCATRSYCEVLFRALQLIYKSCPPPHRFTASNLPFPPMGSLPTSRAGLLTPLTHTPAASTKGLSLLWWCKAHSSRLCRHTTAPGCSFPLHGPQIISAAKRPSLCLFPPRSTTVDVVKQHR